MNTATRDMIFRQLIRDADLPLLFSEYRFNAERKWRFDFCWIDKKIAIEVEGGIHEYTNKQGIKYRVSKSRHTYGDGFTNDCEKYNTATLNGWKLLRFPSIDLCKKETINIIKQLYESI